MTLYNTDPNINLTHLALLLQLLLPLYIYHTVVLIALLTTIIHILLLYILLLVFYIERSGPECECIRSPRRRYNVPYTRSGCRCRASN